MSPRSSKTWGCPRIAASAPAVQAPRQAAPGLSFLGRGFASAYLGFIVLLPLAAIVWKSTENGADGFWRAISSPSSVASLKLSLAASLVVVAINAAAGTLIAWVLVRDSFRGKAFVNALIDLPFALPTIVAGLTLLALYGPRGPLGLNIAYTRVAVVAALLFVTLPFVVRSVQPVLIELDREMEEAAASLGARSPAIFRHIVLPNLAPAILSGCALAFARSVGEFGSVVLISGNIPFKTEVASVHIFSLVESDAPTAGAAVSVVLLFVSLLTLIGFDALRRWRFSGGN